MRSPTMKITKSQFKKIIKEEIEKVMERNPITITAAPLVRAVIKNLVEIEDYEFEHEYHDIDYFDGDEWAHAEQDAFWPDYESGYLPEDIVLPRQRYNLVARAGWYLIDVGINHKYVHGPFASKEDIDPLRDKSGGTSGGYEFF